MDIEQIEQLMQLMQKYRFESLEYKDDDRKIKLCQSGVAASAMPSAPSFPMYPAYGMNPQAGFAASAPAAASKSERGSEEAKASAPAVSRGTKIKSPFVGTFYAAATPGSEPFAQMGKRVKKGDTLCIVEAMKLMNEIEADCDGTIVEILAENEDPVEYDQVLFVIAP